MRFLSLVFLSVLAVALEAKDAQPIFTDYHKAYKAADEKKKPLLIFFQVDGKPAIPLKQLETELKEFTLAQVPSDYEYEEGKLLATASGHPDLKKGGVLLCDFGENGLLPTTTLSLENYSLINFENRFLGEVPPDSLKVQSRLQAYLPKVKNEAVMEALKGRRTFWYDKETMPGVYQDSVPPIVGLRRNSSRASFGIDVVGFFTGANFMFPFADTGGTHTASGMNVVHFIQLPKHGSKLSPIVWLNETIIGDGMRTDPNITYQWIFPIGTIVGEVLFMQNPKDKTPLVFEVRTRTRANKSWKANAFRPFPKATDLASAVKKARPEWENSKELSGLIKHLEDEKNFKTTTLSDPHSATPLGIGGIDELPPIGEDELVIDLLKKTEFVSSVGQPWKENGKDAVHAATVTHTSLSIVPKGYGAGAIAVESAACKKCHENTGRKISDFRERLTLYGQVWGSDEVFSFHPFDAAFASDVADRKSFQLKAEWNKFGLVEKYDSNKHPKERYERIPRAWQ